MEIIAVIVFSGFLVWAHSRSYMRPGKQVVVQKRRPGPRPSNRDRG